MMMTRSLRLSVTFEETDMVGHNIARGIYHKLLQGDVALVGFLGQALGEAFHYAPLYGRGHVDLADAVMDAGG